MATNGPRQPHCATSSAPNVGAMTGAAVKIIVISDISFAASLPDAMSRTTALESTTAEAAPIPCTKRATSSSSILLAIVVAIAATANSVMPAYSVGRRPSRSENSPAGICPTAMPAMNTPTICWPRDRLVLSASAIAGIAGKLKSTVNAAIAVSRPSVMTKLRDLSRWAFKGV